MQTPDKREMHIGQPPDGAKVPQYDFIEELQRLKEFNRGITIDGPAGAQFKKVLDGLLQVLIDKL